MKHTKEMVAFDVLAEQHRRQILDLLRERAHSVGALVDVLALSQPAVSKHLRVPAGGGLRGSSGRRPSGGCTEFGPSRCARSMTGWRRFECCGCPHLDDLERHLDTMPDENDAPGG